jgi:predicted ATP-grasp superfamily ATP-dependent carboligase
MNEKIGIVGINSRAVAASAMRLGFRVHLVDYFSDVDVEADFHYPLQEDPLKPSLDGEYSPDKLVDLAIEKLSGEVDYLLLTSDLGCNPQLVGELEKYFRIQGNSSEQIGRAKNWRILRRIFKEIGMRYPETIAVNSFRDMENAVEEIGFPVVVKSLVKGNGFTPTLVEGLEGAEFYRDVEFKGEVLVQEYIKGEAISSSVLSSGGEAVTLSVNKQLVGLEEFGCGGRFVYCGNIVRLDSPSYEEISMLSSELISRLELTGSNGVDYIISNDNGIYFMEVNTRFQDTLEGVERFRGINLVEEHLKAFEGEIEIHGIKSDRCFGKGILYAERDLQVKDLTGIDG